MPKVLNLFTVARGDCAAHPCDLCITCQAGRCCRKDKPDYALPSLGDWGGQIYGAIGVFRVDDESATCHACGDDFVYVAPHVWWKHDLTAREYKAIFGLKAKQPLSALRMTRWRQAYGRTNHKGVAGLGAKRGMSDWTPEQRSAAAKAGQLVAPQWVAEIHAAHPGTRSCQDCGAEATGSRRRLWRCYPCWKRLRDGAA